VTCWAGSTFLSPKKMWAWESPERRPLSSNEQ
jgi:hypothetical protein